MLVLLIIWETWWLMEWDLIVILDLRWKKPKRDSCGNSYEHIKHRTNRR